MSGLSVKSHVIYTCPPKFYNDIQVAQAAQDLEPL